MTNEPFFAAKVPLCPTTNQSYKTVNFKTKRGNIVRRPGATPALLQFKRDVVKMLAAQRSQQDWSMINDVKDRWLKGEHTHLAVTMTFYLQHMWTSDNDGRIKGTQDAVFDFMGINDNMAVRTVVEKCLASSEPYCEVTVAIKEGFEYVVPAKKRPAKPKMPKKESNEVEVYLRKMRKRGETLAKTVKYPAR